jgi:hypothetical protein
VPLQADVHADLRILPGKLEFAAGNNAIPLVLGEFSLALHHFPILFAGPVRCRWLPSACPTRTCSSRTACGKTRPIFRPTCAATLHLHRHRRGE